MVTASQELGPQRKHCLHGVRRATAMLPGGHLSLEDI